MAVFLEEVEFHLFQNPAMVDLVSLLGGIVLCLAALVWTCTRKGGCNR